MSDIREVAGVLSHHTLECVAFEFTGDREETKMFAAQAAKELRMRGAHFTAARHTIEGDSNGLKNRMTLSIERVADQQVWAEVLEPGQWIVLWLHDERLNWVEKIPASRGEWMFRPRRPVVTLDTVRKALRP